MGIGFGVKDLGFGIRGLGVGVLGDVRCLIRRPRTYLSTLNPES